MLSNGLVGHLHSRSIICNTYLRHRINIFVMCFSEQGTLTSHIVRLWLSSNDITMLRRLYISASISPMYSTWNSLKSSPSSNVQLDVYRPIEFTCQNWLFVDQIYFDIHCGNAVCLQLLRFNPLRPGWNSCHAQVAGGMSKLIWLN